MMKKWWAVSLSIAIAGGVLAGCGSKSFDKISDKISLIPGSKSAPKFVAKNEPWRRTEERACLASGSVRQSSFLAPRSSLAGPSSCGALKPYSMSGAVQGRVRLKPAALLRCPMVPAVDRWLTEIVMPAARRNFGQPVVEIKVAASYSCRPIGHKRGARLSEHGYANAIDISKFVLASGRVVTVKRGWRGNARESRFLLQIHKGGCGIFYTVLGPNYNRAHHDHFHLDLASPGRKGTHRVCK